MGILGRLRSRATALHVEASALRGAMNMHADAVDKLRRDVELATQEKPDPAIPPEPGWWEEWRKRRTTKDETYPPWGNLGKKGYSYWQDAEQLILDHAMRHGDGLKRAAQELKRRYSIACCASPSHPVANHLFKAINPLQEYLSELRTER